MCLLFSNPKVALKFSCWVNNTVMIYISIVNFILTSDIVYLTFTNGIDTWHLKQLKCTYLPFNLNCLLHINGGLFLSNWWHTNRQLFRFVADQMVSYKEQELLTLPGHLGLPLVISRVRVAHHISILYCIWLSSSCVLSTQCYHCISIFNSWLSLRYSRMYIYFYLDSSKSNITD